MFSTGTDHDVWDDFAADDDIFFGVESMIDVWEVMIADLAEFGTIVMTDSVVADGVEGLEITGLSIDDPDFGEPVTVATVRVSAFGVAGVGEGGEPTYFDVEVVDIDYMGIAQVAAMDMGVPLADMDTGTASIIARVMPEGDDADLGLSIEISDSFSLAFDAMLEGELAGFESIDSSLIRTAALSITDIGFIGALIDSQAPLSKC